MKCYANLYRDTEGHGFLDDTFDTSDEAKQQKSDTLARENLEYVATVAIVVLSDAPVASHRLMKSALLNAAITPRESMTYKRNYVIHANPYQLDGSSEWAVGVTIVYDRGADTRIDEFKNEELRFPSRDLAVSRCLAFGRQLIDEQLAD